MNDCSLIAHALMIKSEFIAIVEDINKPHLCSLLAPNITRNAAVKMIKENVPLSQSRNTLVELADLFHTTLESRI